MLRYGLCLALLMEVAVPLRAAERGIEDREIDAKLETILRKLEDISRRVDRIEQVMSRAEQWRMPGRAPASFPASPLKPPLVDPVNEVFQLLRESPGKLLEDIPQRQRRLRKRQFLPEIY